MRNCVLTCWLAFSLTGCGLMSSFYDPPKGGGPSTAETVQSVVKQLPYGEIISGIIGLGGLIYGADRHSKHKKTCKENRALKAQIPPPPA